MIIIIQRPSRLLSQVIVPILSISGHRAYTRKTSFFLYAINKMATPFSRLPMELQAKVMNNISLYSNLKAFCLVSYGIAKPIK